MNATVQEERCSGCGGPISVWEEGRCAFCRSDDRGDNQLLAHDSRGYLDEDGVTRIPCGCGCERPVIVPEPRDMELDDVKDILGHGTEVEIRLPREPEPWRREWIESLGGRIVIDPDAPMPLALQNDREDEAMTNGVRASKWTRESVIEAIQDFAREHGRPPMTADFAGGKGPSGPTCVRIFGSWGDAVVAAGFPRPQRGKVPAPLATPGETPDTPPAVEPEADPEPEPAPLPVPAAPPEPPAPRPVAADPEKVDTFELFASLASEERIAYYETLAKHCELKAAALRTIREATLTVRELEPA